MEARGKGWRGGGAGRGAGRRRWAPGARGRGVADAEIRAFDEAGDLARGATLYCTLEPCFHVGKTGPCVERVAAARVARVVAASEDPNPVVSGRGFDFLRQKGIEVQVGVGRER